MTKSTCTPKRKALAKTLKKHHGFHAEGGKITGNALYDEQLMKFIKDYASPHTFAAGGLTVPTDDSEATLNGYDQNVDNMQIPGEYNPSQFQTLQSGQPNLFMPSPLDGQLIVNAQPTTKKLNDQVSAYNRTPQHKAFARQMYNTNTNTNYKYVNGMPPIAGHGPGFESAAAKFDAAAQTGNPYQMLGADFDIARGTLKAVGDIKQNQFTKQYDNNQLFNQLDGSLRDQFSTFKPDDLHGQMKNELQNKYGGKIFSKGGKLPCFNCGGKMKDGGEILHTITNPMPQMFDMDMIKSLRQNSNSEVEGGEVLKTPQGLIAPITGDRHEQGGVPVNAPETKVLSDRLKFQFKPDQKEKTFADEAKKYSTDVDIENLNSKYADTIAKDTANLNMKMKNQKVDSIYNIQEMGKMIGHFGAAIQKKALGGTISKYADGGESTNGKVDPTYLRNNEYYAAHPNMFDPGHEAEYAEGYKYIHGELVPTGANKGIAGGVNNTINPNNINGNPNDTQDYSIIDASGTKTSNSPYGSNIPINLGIKGPTSAYKNVDDIYSAALKKGYKGANNIGDLQDWAATEYPTETSDYMKTVPMTNLGATLSGEPGQKFNDPFNKYTHPLGSNYSSDQRLTGFRDRLWDFRFPDVSQFGDKKAPTTPAEVKTDPYTPQFNVNQIAKANTTKNRYAPGIIPFPVFNTYQEDPLQTSQLNPHLINYRPTDKEPAIAEANKGFRAATKGLDTSSTGQAGTAQNFANSWRAKQGIYADDFNRSQQGKQGVDQYNTQELDRTDQLNLNERNRFMDLINRGKGVIDTQKRTDAQGALQNYYNANSYYSSADYIKNTFGNNPEAVYNYLRNPLAGTMPFDPTADIKTKVKSDNKGKTSTETTTSNKYGGKILKKRK